MTGVSRGARARRGGRSRGWLLLTALLVLAIGASAALVFTDRVELLKLAVILALWAAVVTAFVSVTYRRQSESDRAKAKDLKMVYDLQLDREISARREYELAVESHLRRELAAELQSEAADEVAALRAELAALRSSLQILFDTELAHQPALETERRTTRAYSDWQLGDENPSPDRVSSSRVSPVRRDEPDIHTAESPIIDVPEEPHPLESEWIAPMYGGAHRRPSESAPAGNRVWTPSAPEPAPEPRPAPWRIDPVYRPEPAAYAPPPPSPPVSPPEPERRGRHGSGQDSPPVAAEGRWPLPSAPVSAFSPAPPPAPLRPPENGFAAAGGGGNGGGPGGGHRAAHREPESPRGRHWSPPESDGTPADARADVGPPPAPPVARHSAAGDDGAHPAPSAFDRPARAPQLGQPAPRHRTPEEAPADRADTGGQPVSDLLARLRGGPTEGGGRRRRREE